jgi:hypothetical protein
MKLPIRIQRARTRGAKLPSNTVCITRGTQYGNPFKVGGWFKFGGLRAADGFLWMQSTAPGQPGFTIIKDNAMAAEWYRELRRRSPLTRPQIEELSKADHIACFCKPGEPCHGDVLIEILRDIYE